MEFSKEKNDFLKQNGFTSIPDRMVYVNKKRMIIISNVAIDDNSLEQLKTKIDKSPGSNWFFIFNEPPSKEVKEELINLF